MTWFIGQGRTDLLQPDSLQTTTNLMEPRAQLAIGAYMTGTLVPRTRQELYEYVGIDRAISPVESKYSFSPKGNANEDFMTITVEF